MSASRAALELLARKARTRRELEEALERQGFAAAEVATALEELRARFAELSPEGEGARLEDALEKKRRGLPAGLTPAARSKKLLAHLVRRGFDPDAVLEALRRKGELDDDQELDLSRGP